VTFIIFLYLIVIIFLYLIVIIIFLYLIVILPQFLFNCYYFTSVLVREKVKLSRKTRKKKNKKLTGK